MSTGLFENSVYWVSMAKIHPGMKLFCSEGKKRCILDDSLLSRKEKKKI